MTTREFQILPKCPDCDRLSVDNPQHCADKSVSDWLKTCRWKKCVGSRVIGGKKVRCGKVYSAPGWPGFTA